MAIMEKLKMFVVQEPIVAASCLIGGFGLFLPAFVRPMLDSFESTKQVPPPALSDPCLPQSHQSTTRVFDLAYNLHGGQAQALSVKQTI
ncbi:hypothetical protein R6Q57_025003 [Mikania cordata]